MAKRGPSFERTNLDFIEHSDITQVAQAIGLQLDQKKTKPRRAICPFHNDTDPSLHLYHSGSSMAGRDHYHCFVCGAHGDALSLVQNFENLSFWEAAKRLADFQGIELPKSGRAAVDRRSGLGTLSERIDAASLSDSDLKSFAEDRGFSPKFIKEFGGGIIELRGLIDQAAKDRAAEEKFVAAGILRRKSSSDDQPNFDGVPLQGFFSGKRLVFKVADTQQGIAGFIARSLSGGKYKYLYSYGFPRRSTLFGLDHVLAKLREKPKDNDDKQLNVFLVEGIFDVLRLNSLGFSAVGILGSRISSGNNSQIERLKFLAETAAQSGVDLKFRVFLDHDEAGRSGSDEAVIELIKLLDKSSPFDVDVISVPVDVEDKSDPDTLLKTASQSEANEFIEAASVTALRYLAAFRLNSDPHQLDLGKPGRMKLVAKARQVALALGDISIPRALGPIEVDANDELLDGFYQSILSYSSNAEVTAPISQNQEYHKETLDDRAALLTALSFGRASTLKREYPLEDDAWERLAVAASPLFHLHCERLRIADSPSAPLLTKHVPKGDGRYRMKSGPVAEDAILQQYVLLELLRDRSNTDQFSKGVPAIRYRSGELDNGGIYRTGSKKKRDPLSFAYQVDMDVVNGAKPPGRTGIFRHFFDCWRSFIDYLDDQIRLFDTENLQILRLDITGFYDHIRRNDVSTALSIPLNDALNVLPEAADGKHRFAPLLERGGDPHLAHRATIVTDFLLNHSFGCSYTDPKTGKKEDADKMIGIPQGPDLSAYLANISLFGLDDMMQDEISKLNAPTKELLLDGAPLRVKASYARYVDDLILICPDMDTAFHLRRKIEAYLKDLGLTLNRKNTTPPPMTRAEARSWLTDNRAGFGFSGPLAELPTTDAMDPLADAGEIDRKSALGLLYDPELDDPQNGDKHLDKIRLALSAPDIRFGDRAKAFRRLWYMAALKQENPSGEGLASSFLSLLGTVEPFSLELEQSSDCLDVSLACLDGLENALRQSIPRDELSEDRIEHFELNQLRLSKCVLDDVFGPLANGIFKGNDTKELLSRHDVRSQIGIMACLAANRILSEKSKCDLLKLAHYFSSDNYQPRSELQHGLWLSLFRIDRNSVDAPSSLVMEGQVTAKTAFAKINREIVKLQQIEVNGPAEDDDATNFPLVQTGKTVEDITSLTALILGVWSRSNAEVDDANVGKPLLVELDAAATFINITYQHFGDVVQGRKRLLQLIANNSSAHPLPSPPGLETSGILLWSENQLLLATTEDAEQNILGVDWLVHDDPKVLGINLRRANLPEGSKPLYLAGLDWTPGTISSTYRRFLPHFLTQTREEDSTDLLPVPTAFSFFGKIDDKGLDPTSTKLICWAAKKESVDSNAFVRNGTSLEPRKVFPVDANFWRYGWAIRDLCNRPDLITDEEGGPDVQASVPLTDKVHRKEAMLARVLPRISGADKWGAGGSSNDTSVPTRIDRTLKLLESFENSSTQEDDASYLISALAEGVFMSDRINKGPDLTIPGKAASQIVGSVRRLSKGLPEAAKLWAPMEDGVLSYERRSARAWAVLGEKVKRHIPKENPQQSLETLVLGLEVTAVVFDLRALAFELSSLLTRDDLQLLDQSSFELSWVEGLVGPNILLFDNGSLNPRSDLEQQVQSLVLAFTDITLKHHLNNNFLRDKITPSGWVVILAIILQVLPVSEVKADSTTHSLRPKLWQMSPDQSANTEDVLKSLLDFLSAPGEVENDEEDWPWTSFEKLGESKPQNLAELLRTLTELTGLKVADEISPINPRTGDSHAGRPIMRLADGTSQTLSGSQIDIAYTLGERGSKTEAKEDTDHRMIFNYSVSRLGAKVIGVHLVSRLLSEVTLQNQEPLPSREKLNKKAASKSTKTKDLMSTPVQADSSVGSETDNLSESPVQEPPSSISRTPNRSLQELSEEQLQKWQRRSNGRSPDLRRLAIVQWDVAETYYQPTHKNGKYEGLLINGKPATTANLVGKNVALSTTEFRRRKILERVLEACIAFEVEGIVLPEYSVRPETVNWLARAIKRAGSSIIVWCGTFRVPSGSKIDQFRNDADSSVPFSLASIEPTPTDRSPWFHHSALLTCLRGTIKDPNPEVQVEHFVRQKRYPAAAAGELIRPPISIDWHPLLEHVKDPFDLGTYALELICAEMFPHASSSNFVGVLEENTQLFKRYEPGLKTPGLLESLNKEIHTFAKWTAYRSIAKSNLEAAQDLYRGTRLRRTLIVLPAMTTRTADYHIFGQNQYLAAGLVTAFCNAVTPKLGIGQSAFVGLNGWTAKEETETPYGTLAPGIYQPGNSEPNTPSANRVHSGPLGNNEAAIVIADLDLIRTTDQKPRPHYQSKPLRIVAHLPMIFATEYGNGSGKFDYPNGNRKERMRSVGKTNKQQKFEDAISIFETAIEADTKSRPFRPLSGSKTEASEEHLTNVMNIRSALKMLEAFVDDSGWMKKRTSSFENQRFDYPPEFPMPALWDWLYIDDRWSREESDTYEFDQYTDPMTSDLPLLVVGNEYQDEPTRKGD